MKANEQYADKKMRSEQQAILRTTNDDLVCKDCLLRLPDDIIFGNTTSCEQFPDHTKPNEILLGKECSYYVKE